MDGTRYTFDVYGVYNGLFVMRDRETGSVWTHFEGTVITGPLASEGLRLEITPILHIHWGEWQSLYPETTVLDWYPEYVNQYREFRPGQSGLGRQFQESLLNWDERLPESELVLGTTAGGEYRAYVISELGTSIGVINDTLGGVSIVVFIDPMSNFAMAFESTIEDRQLEFFIQDGDFKDGQGSTWSVEGKAIAGGAEGSQLPYVTSFVTEWYGWAAYHPETTIYNE